MDGGKFLYQLLKAATGFVFAVIGAGLFLAWGIFGTGAGESDPVLVGTIVGTGLVGASIAGAAAFAPALFLIAIAEIARLRGVVLHIAAGGLLALLLWTLGGAQDGLRPGSAVALAAGFIAGGIYWLVAGRTSGCWRVTSGTTDPDR